MGNTPVTTSAPGKLFLFGEYGVLTGGWSVVASVGRRVVARRTEEPTGYSALGAKLDDPTALPRAVLAELGDEPVPTSLAQLETDVRQFFVPRQDGDDSDKLGLGSSAASTVALTAACILNDIGELDEPVRRRIFDRAFAAHRRLQGGRGSGADVAAAAFGGVFGYRLVEVSSGFPSCEAAALPAAPLRLRQTEMRFVSPTFSIRIEPIWLGKPAVSTSFVSCCRQALERSPQEVHALLCRTSELAHKAIERLMCLDDWALLELVDQADRTLEALGEAIEAPIVTDKHRQLRAVAKEAGIHVKPSGAGGGDFSLAFGPHDAAWSSFLARLPQRCRHIPLEFGVDGARLE